MRSDPCLLLKLCENLHDQDTSSIQVKITKFLEAQTNAQQSFLMFVSDDQDELCCKVVGDKVLDEEVKFPIQSNSFSTAIVEKRSLVLEDIKNDHQDFLQKLLGYQPDTLLCVPILHPKDSDKVIILANLVNKESFLEEDEEMVIECFSAVVPLLLMTQAYEEEKRLREQCQSLLTVAKNLFTHLDDVKLLLKEIMTEARNLTSAERCSLFLLDKEQNELIAKVFDGNLADDGSENLSEVRIPASQGIAGHVATTGELLNIHDAYAHPLFYRKIDETTGFKTRSILCFPIKDENGVIGVAELCNKINRRFFTSFDEEIAKAFSIYCGISIMHSLMWKKVRDGQHRSQLSNELMMYHMKVSQEEVTNLNQTKIPRPSDFHEDFCKFYYTPRFVPEAETPLAVLCMFDDLGMIARWRIRRETLSRFILMVSRGYRNPPYHNWMHAFAVSHFCFLLLNNLRLMGTYLKHIEGFALFVACMCHDLDHRGTNNSFQLASKSVLAALYSSEGSVMERHHFAQAMAIINTDGCNVFESLSKKDYTKCLDYMRDIILATDLAHHLRIMKDIGEMAEVGYSSDDPQHHKLLLSLLVTACDLSDQTKDWPSSKKIAKQVYSEFFSQGDLEKAMGNSPSEMMDREKACVPQLQIAFLQTIVQPVYELLAKLFPEAEETAQAVATNKMYWERMQEIYKRRHLTSSCSLDLFEDQSLEKEVLEGLSNSNRTC
ncbi:cGMP-dependent 3',5'-cyclic phosphodiesterase-like isoform X2 [Limulus polyphemus]|uniref:Phosphodiesterase n=1 Tax=Limulus polyphemus TaxID=6850 RepID=A0ABM1TEZ6_LIMPO|nr:cGMP-dependent 3',5'-cyclic phosphodiesterase-like isoform X2 [Limulus polyphemus]